ncbi:MAG: aldehyde dehydrogenase family protein, partial [Legionellales bacterium]|nr:aldehyde dehydrogenase family protein [Legionellales bacterium]
SRQLYGKTIHSERPLHRMYEQWHPLGTIGIITSFNFPGAIWAWNAMIAMVCGNVCIWKPSEKTPLSAIAITKICYQILSENKMPAIFGLFIPESHDVSKIFLEDNQIPLISFTGSIKTGKFVSQTVAKRLGKTILELGGNNAIIVDKDADLAKSILAVLFGAIGTAGQRCTTTRRVFVYKNHFEHFIALLRKTYQNIKIGDPLDPTNHMGPLIDQNAIDIFVNTIAQIKKDNGEIIFGGNTIQDSGFYVEPTIVTGLAPNSLLLQEENFVPIIYIIPFNTLDEAIDLQNNVKQGLSSAIFTENLITAEKFLSSAGSDCGIANVNIGTSGAEIGGAFGGEKETGGGRESGSDCWKGYMRRQTNTINWSDKLELAQNIKFTIKISEET